MATVNAFSRNLQKRYTPPEEENLPAEYSGRQPAADSEGMRFYGSEERLFRLLCRTGENATLPLDALRAAAGLLGDPLLAAPRSAEGEKRIGILLGKKEWTEQDCRDAAAIAVEGKNSGAPAPQGRDAAGLCPAGVAESGSSGKSFSQDDPAWISIHVASPDPPSSRARSGERPAGKKPSRPGRRWLLVAALFVLGAVWALHGKGCAFGDTGKTAQSPPALLRNSP